MQQKKYKQIMQKRQKYMTQKIKDSNLERGVLLVLTGNGKGKSSSSYGMAIRALAHQQQVAIIQFVKSGTASGEQKFFAKQKAVNLHTMGDGFTWDTKNFKNERIKCDKAWQLAKKYLNNDKIDLLILDELNVALGYGFIKYQDIRNEILSRPLKQSIIITGRTAPLELIQDADTVSEIKNIKHAFNNKIKAREGIEF